MKQKRALQPEKATTEETLEVYKSMNGTERNKDQFCTISMQDIGAIKRRFKIKGCGVWHSVKLKLWNSLPQHVADAKSLHRVKGQSEKFTEGKNPWGLQRHQLSLRKHPSCKWLHAESAFWRIILTRLPHLYLLSCSPGTTFCTVRPRTLGRPLVLSTRAP